MSFRQDGNEICVKYEQQKLVVKAIRDDIVNIFVPYRTKEHYSKAIDGDKAVATELTAEQKGEDLVIATDKIRMQFGENLEMVITRPDGTPLVRTHRQGRSVCGEVSEQMKQILESEGHDTSNLGAHDYPVQMMFDLDEGDDFYGLGDKTGFLNKKNYEYENWNSDIPQAHNEDYHALYKSIPVLFCKKKNDVYGMFFDNTFHSYLNLGKENPEYYFYGADDGNLDLYFLGGEKLTDLIEEYTYLTGADTRCRSDGRLDTSRAAGAISAQKISVMWQNISVIWIFRVVPFILTLIIWMGIVCLHGMMQSTENLGI